MICDKLKSKSIESKRLMLQFLGSLAHCKDAVVKCIDDDPLGEKVTFPMSALHAANARRISGVSKVFSSTYWYEIVLLLS